MTEFDALRSPVSFLQSRLPNIPHRDLLEAEEGWWKGEGVAISGAIDRAGTPWLRMFDRGRMFRLLPGIYDIVPLQKKSQKPG